METINMFEKGDKFIHFTKYGGVNRGEVEEIRELNVWDINNLCTYIKYSIFTTNGVSLNLDGSDGKIYKVKSEMSPEKANNLNMILKKASNNKYRLQLNLDDKIIHKIDED